MDIQYGDIIHLGQWHMCWHPQALSQGEMIWGESGHGEGVPENSSACSQCLEVRRREANQILHAWAILAVCAWDASSRRTFQKHWGPRRENDQDILHIYISHWQKFKCLIIFENMWKQEPQVPLEESYLQSPLWRAIWQHLSQRHTDLLDMHSREIQAHGWEETFMRIFAAPLFVRKPNYKHLNAHQ